MSVKRIRPGLFVAMTLLSMISSCMPGVTLQNKREKEGNGMRPGSRSARLSAPHPPIAGDGIRTQ